MGVAGGKKQADEPLRFSQIGLSPVRAREKERILYVEDEDEEFRAAEVRLRDAFFLCRASSARDACQRLRHDSNFSAILMDVELSSSDLDGVQLTKLLRGRLRRDAVPAYAQDLKPIEVPIIFLTAQSAKYTDTVLMLSGAEKVMAKPLECTALNLALTQLHLSRARQKSRTHI